MSSPKYSKEIDGRGNIVGASCSKHAVPDLFSPRKAAMVSIFQSRKGVA